MEGSCGLFSLVIRIKLEASGMPMAGHRVEPDTSNTQAYTTLLPHILLESSVPHTATRLKTHALCLLWANADNIYRFINGYRSTECLVVQIFCGTLLIHTVTFIHQSHAKNSYGNLRRCINIVQSSVSINCIQKSVAWQLTVTELLRRRDLTLTQRPLRLEICCWLPTSHDECG
jgi:hypothetical protein